MANTLRRLEMSISSDSVTLSNVQYAGNPSVKFDGIYKVTCAGGASETLMDYVRRKWCISCNFLVHCILAFANKAQHYLRWNVGQHSDVRM